MMKRASFLVLTVLLTLVGATPVMAASNSDLADDVVSVTVANIPGDSTNCSITFTGDNLDDTLTNYQVNNVGSPGYIQSSTPVAGSFNDSITATKASSADKDWSLIELYYYPAGGFAPWPVRNFAYSNTCDASLDDVVTLSVTNSKKDATQCKVLFVGKNVSSNSFYFATIGGLGFAASTTSKGSFRNRYLAPKGIVAGIPKSSVIFDYNEGAYGRWPLRSVTYTNTCTA